MRRPKERETSRLSAASSLCGLRLTGVAEHSPVLRPNTSPGQAPLEETVEADISKLQKTGHFYFALTPPTHAVLGRMRMSEVRTLFGGHFARVEMKL